MRSSGRRSSLHPDRPGLTGVRDSKPSIIPYTRGEQGGPADDDVTAIPSTSLRPLVSAEVLSHARRTEWLLVGPSPSASFVQTQGHQGVLLRDRPLEGQPARGGSRCFREKVLWCHRHQGLNRPRSTPHRRPRFSGCGLALRFRTSSALFRGAPPEDRRLAAQRGLAVPCRCPRPRSGDPRGNGRRRAIRDSLAVVRAGGSGGATEYRVARDQGTLLRVSLERWPVHQSSPMENDSDDLPTSILRACSWSTANHSPRIVRTVPRFFGELQVGRRVQSALRR